MIPSFMRYKYAGPSNWSFFWIMPLFVLFMALVILGIYYASSSYTNLENDINGLIRSEDLQNNAEELATRYFNNKKYYIIAVTYKERNKYYYNIPTVSGDLPSESPYTKYEYICPDNWLISENAPIVIFSGYFNRKMQELTQQQNTGVKE